MKIYGYSITGSDELKEMKEISLQATSERLRELAEFLLMSANEIDSGSDNSPDHFHLQDYSTNWDEEFPDIVVVSPNIYSDKGS